MTIAEIYIGLVAGAKDGHEGVYAFNNCDFFANDWEEVQP